MSGSLQTDLRPGRMMADMSGDENPAIVAVARLSDGLVVNFADGTCVFYSSALLYGVIPQAETLDEAEEAW